MTTRPDQPCPRTYLATINLGDISALASRGLALTQRQRTQVAGIGDIRVHVNADATPDATNRHARTLIGDRLADVLGTHRGLNIAVDVAAGTGEVYLTPLGGLPQRAARITVHTADSPLVEIGEVA